MKEPVNTSKYSEYAIELKSEKEYKKVLEYFKDKLNLPISYAFGYCDDWTYFGFDSRIMHNQWRLINKTIKEPHTPYSKVISLDEFIKITGIPMDEDVITEYAGLKVGDVLKKKILINGKEKEIIIMNVENGKQLIMVISLVIEL